VNGKDNQYGKRANRNDIRRTMDTFSLFLVPHDKKWEDNYKEIESVLKEILQKTVRKAHSFR
jgi:GrpB-like predicted nucleotidyltransferase (UPF0157 family)